MVCVDNLWITSLSNCYQKTLVLACVNPAVLLLFCYWQLRQDRKKERGTMTRKDYQLIAGVFAHFAEIVEIHETIGADIAEVMADALAQENPRFDRAKFLTACGVN